MVLLTPGFGALSPELGKLILLCYSVYGYFILSVILGNFHFPTLKAFRLSKDPILPKMPRPEA